MDEKLSKVNFLCQYLSSSRSEEQVLDMAMMISHDILGYDHAIVRFVEGDRLVSRKWIGFPREAADLLIRVGEGITGEVARTGESMMVDDTLKDPRFITGAEGTRSELCVPLIYNDRVIGVFNVESERPAFFTRRDKNLLETLASQIAAAVETARLREELSKAEKLSVVGSMASSILHDIRNDIHRLRACSDLLKRKDAPQERTERISEMVRKSADNVYGLIEDIFDFVKTGRTMLQLEKTHLAPLLDSIAGQLLASAPENVSMTVDADPALELPLDKRRFRRMMLNLLNNAVEAMPRGGRIRLEAAADENGRVLIRVSDTGVGIEKARIPRIWDALYTHGKKDGTGFGMAIVKKIVEDHGWSVAVESEKGKGTTFTITAATAGAESVEGGPAGR